MSRKNTNHILLATLFCVLLGCDNKPSSDTSAVSNSAATAAGNSIAEDRTILSELSEQKRQAVANLSFEEFERTVFKEEFENGKYIVNGDTPIANKKLLREFYEANVKRKPQAREEGETEFIINTVGGLDTLWPPHKKRAISYCVSDQFGPRQQKVIAAMQTAAAAWEQAADIKFKYLANNNNRCNAANTNVTFDVRPVNVLGHYLARAFFPNETRSKRNLLIDDSSFALNPNGRLTLTGILRHELGHVIGARHEHTRPDSGKCFEDNNWRPLTNYDAFSVMHYPHCNGQGDWTLQLTERDKSGTACVYGAAPGFDIDPSIVNDINDCASSNTPSQSGGQPRTQVFNNQVVAAGEEKRYGDFSVVPGSVFVATMTTVAASSGDPDLYLAFDRTPVQGLEYDCRPYAIGANEACDVVVPNGVSVARILVHGYRAGAYQLNVNYVEAGGG